MSDSVIILVVVIAGVVFWVGIGLVVLKLAADGRRNLNTLLDRAEKREIGPQPFEVTEAKELATKQDVADVKRDLGERVGKLEDEDKAMRKEMVAARQAEEVAAAERRKGIYDMIRNTESALRTEIKGTNDRIENVREELDGKLETMPERVIAILRNTGALKS